MAAKPGRVAVFRKCVAIIAASHAGMMSTSLLSSVVHFFGITRDESLWVVLPVCWFSACLSSNLFCTRRDTHLPEDDYNGRKTVDSLGALCSEQDGVFCSR